MGGTGAGSGAGGGGGDGAGGSATKWSKKKKAKTGELYSLNIVVINEPEEPVFKPSVKSVSVSENPEENILMEVIAVYAATDADTGEPAEHVR